MDNLISQKVNSVSITHKNSTDNLVVINQIIKTHRTVSQTRKPVIEKTGLEDYSPQKNVYEFKSIVLQMKPFSSPTSPPFPPEEWGWGSWFCSKQNN